MEKTMQSTEEKRLMDRLAAIHQRVNWMADEEARSALVNGWAAQGGYMKAKEQLIDEAERILDKLEEGLGKGP